LRDALLTTTALPAPAPDLSTPPVRVDRRKGAALVTQRYFPVSPRTLEGWPLPWLLVNGKATCLTADLFAVAQAKIDAAPQHRTSRGQAA
jgi:hypothetical protein